MNALQPDLIALTGDYIHRGRSWVPGCMREFARLRAPSGVAAVLGNHDNYVGAAATVRNGLRHARITDLTNTNFRIKRGKQLFFIGGVGDLWTENQKIHQALKGSHTAKSTLLLSHNPDYVEQIVDERVGLVLSGHTHGGQCVFPLISAPILPSKYGQKYASGLCHGPVASVYVSRGVGCGFPPIRFCCPPEIALITLKAGGKAS